MVRNGLSLAAMLLLGACTTVGPDYHVPDNAKIAAADANGAFISTTAVTSAAPLQDRWWKLYDDPVLDSLIAQAFDANTDLRMAEANLTRSLALLDVSTAAREVQAGFGAEASYAQRSAEAELQHVKPPSRPIFNLGLTASYDLDLFGGLRRGIEARNADAEAAVAARDLVRITVAAETARAYADVCNSGFQIDVAQKLIGVQENGLRLTQALVDHGRIAAYELDRRRITLETSRARLPRLAARQRNALFRIAALQGRTPGEADLGLSSCHRPLEPVQALPVGDGQALLKRRPDIRIAERRLASATARIGVEIAALYPDIQLGASIGSTGATADFLSPLTNRFAIGPMIKWTINRHAVRARIKAAEAQGQADLAGFDGAVLTALREVESALTSYAADIDQQRSLDLARDQAARLSATTTRLRRGGRIAELPALEAERDLLTAAQAAAEGRAALNADQITLFLALGGGWAGDETRTSAPPKP